MELQEKITALESEKNHLNELVFHLTAEKIALDQMCGEYIKTIFTTKKDLAFINAQLVDARNQIQVLTKEKEVAEKQFETVRDKYSTIE